MKKEDYFETHWVCRYHKKEGQIIRKLFCALLAAITAVALCACGEEESNPDSSRNAVSTSVTAGSQIDENNSDDDSDQIWANDFTPISEFYYDLDKENRTITLKDYEGDREKIMLSPVYSIDGVDYDLVSMGDDACFMGEISITSVYIPEGVTYIGDSCFNSCAALEYLYLPSTLQSVTDNFLSYIDEYNLYCDSTANLPAERDTNDYAEIIDDRSQGAKLGESAGGAVNGFLAGLMAGEDGSVTTEIYFGGTEEQWKSIRE